MRAFGLRAAVVLFGSVFFLAGCATVPPVPPGMEGVPAHVIAAVSDLGRPATDLARDAALKPSQLLAFTGVRSGARVVDLIPAGGYWTRILSKAVGPRGKIYAYVPDELTKLADREPAVAAITRDSAYANTTLYVRKVSDFQLPETVDLIFNGQHYHDMKSPILGPVDMRAFGQAAFAALKPGGTYIVVDFVAAAGSGARDAATLGRVDPAMVKSDAAASGFVFIGEIALLADLTDTHSARAQEGQAGRTDQFVYRFAKPR